MKLLKQFHPGRAAHTPLKRGANERLVSADAVYVADEKIAGTRLKQLGNLK
jgi:hypothetical protein